MPMFRQELVERLILDYIESIKLDHSKLEKIKKEEKADRDNTEKQIKTIKAELKQIEDRKKKWQYMFVEDLISEKDLRKRRFEEEQKEEELQIQLETLQLPLLNDAPNLEELVELKDIWPLLDDREKKDVILATFDEIVLHTPLERAHGKAGEYIPASILSVRYK